MRKWKILTFVFLGLFAISLLYGMIATVVVNTIRDDWNVYKDQWDETGYSYSELWEKYSETLDKYTELLGNSVSSDASLIPFKAISEDVVVGKVSETTLVAIYPYSDEIVGSFTDSPDLIMTGIREMGATKCIVMFVSEEAERMGGIIINTNGTVERFDMDVEH